MVELVYSGVFEYKVSPRIPSGKCDISIFRYKDGFCCVVMSERKDNKGMPVTSACERIATQVYSEFLTDTPANKIVWLEYYPPRRQQSAHIDIVQFQIVRTQPGHDSNKTKTVRFSNPKWKRFLKPQKRSIKDFVKNYAAILRELMDADIIFVAEDRGGYEWRIWADRNGLFVMTSNPSAITPNCLLDAHGVTDLLGKNRRFFGTDVNIEEQFTTALMKGFLNRGL
ncbi:MAG: hypothetical protein HY099_04585 [Nitrospirae bacterium]|nr:hypothetical protein [Nitrospirota bacterium]